VQNTILPFTRNAVGPMDYTPVGLSDNKYPHKTTAAHELALQSFLIGMASFRRQAISLPGAACRRERVSEDGARNLG